jgi:enterochelin esterase-like enzyme
MTPFPTVVNDDRRRSRRLPLALALVIALAATLLAVPALPADAQTTSDSVEIDLEGPAQFRTGDDLAWADPDFDDSAWSTVQVPFNNHPAFNNYDGFGWYRVTFDLPAEAEGTNLVASMGYIDDADEVYLNGVLIGRSGSFPPNADAQWFEQRLYPIPADAPNYGGRNVIAVRAYDMSGAGGWYQGPIGIFSKDALRENVYGITGQPADARTTRLVERQLERQARALATGNLGLYLSTLRPDYIHDGYDLDRRERQLESWLEESGGSLTLTDGEVEVIRTDDGRLLVDTNRSIVGLRDGQPYEFEPRAQEFLVLNPNSLKEAGNRSRFFRDGIDSELQIPGRTTFREYMVYLPPSYYEQPDRDYPVVYLLHGINGGSREWEPRAFGDRLDAMYAANDIAESIVIMPDGESLWYSNTPTVRWRDMFIQEMLPTVESEYRILAEREFRALSGVSMGGFGAWQMGWSFPELFSSIASHMASLTFTGVPGFTTPVNLANQLDADLMRTYTYYMDVCAFDNFGFANGHRTMSSRLTARDVPHTLVIYPTGGHNDDCWLPNIASAFTSHSNHWRANGLVEATPVRPGR